MNSPTNRYAPEGQLKTITLTYSAFCLLIGVVALHADSSNDTSVEWRRLYRRLGGGLIVPPQGFADESAAHVAELRERFRQCISEVHQFSNSFTFSGVTACRRAQVAEIAGLVAASYLSDLGGLLAPW
jgi:hypothetical protein